MPTNIHLVAVKCDFSMKTKCDTTKANMKNGTRKKLLCVKSTSSSSGSSNKNGIGGSNQLLWYGNEAKCGNSAPNREQLMYIYSHVDANERQRRTPE